MKRNNTRIIIAAALIFSLFTVPQSAHSVSDGLDITTKSTGARLQENINREEFCEMIIKLYNALGGKAQKAETDVETAEGEQKIESEQAGGAPTVTPTPTPARPTLPALQEGEQPTPTPPRTVLPALAEEQAEEYEEKELTVVDELDAILKREQENQALYEGGTQEGDMEHDGDNSVMQGSTLFADTNNAAVLKAYSLGIVSGVSERRFEPKSLLTRQEACVMLVRLIDLCIANADISLHTKNIFDDDGQLSYWAKSPVNYLYYHQIITGKQQYIIAPLDNITVGEATEMINRVYQNKDKFAVKTDITEQWEWAIEPLYNGLGADTKFSGGLAAVCQSGRDGKYGYIDKQGSVVIDFQFDDAFEFSEGMAKVVKDKLYGFTDKKGTLVIACEYEDAGNFSEGYVWLKKDGKYGFADKSGKIIVPLEYEYAYSFSEGLAPVKKNGKYGYINNKNEIVIPFNFPWASSFSEGYARTGYNSEYSYIDKTGEVVLDLKYDYLYDFKDGRAIVFNRDQYSVIDKQGDTIIPFNSWGFIFGFSEGLSRVHPNSGYEGNYAYIDLTGKRVIGGVTLHDANEFSEGLAAIAVHVKKTDKVMRSYMNKKGEYVFPKREQMSDTSEYDDNTFYIQQFSEGMAAAVTTEGKLGFIRNPLLY